MKYFIFSLRFRNIQTILALIMFTLMACNTSVKKGKPSDNTAKKLVPQLCKHGKISQLNVDGKPFLMLGGELHNSSSSSLRYMKPVWQHLVNMKLNTVIVPLSWELIEPEENNFDFKLVDRLILDARTHDLKIVFLWLASWKNGMSSYIPGWVKQDYKNFSRVKIQKGITTEILSTFSEANVQADAKAFSKLMKHICSFDYKHHTVLMMQIENEVGILGDSRDHSAPADSAFASDVPEKLIDYLVRNKDNLNDELKSRWEKNDFLSSGNWEALFGKGPETDEIFMAWNYGCYLDKVAEEGKKEYNIPMYANAWLNQECCPDPGKYPSGGPLPHVMDIWLAAAPHIDLFAPDIYVPDFELRCQKFTQHGNPLFIPEMRLDQDGIVNVFIALGSYNAIGVSPFGIDGNDESSEQIVSKIYETIAQISPLILDKQGKDEMTGFVIDENTPVLTKKLGNYTLEISLDALFGSRAKKGYGIVMTDSTDAFIGAGSGFRVQFKAGNQGTKIIGLKNVDEGEYHDGKWHPLRRLNGDEDDQGQAWRFSGKKISIEKCIVYKYE